MLAKVDKLLKSRVESRTQRKILVKSSLDKDVSDVGDIVMPRYGASVASCLLYLPTKLDLVLLELSKDKRRCRKLDPNLPEQIRAGSNRNLPAWAKKLSSLQTTALNLLLDEYMQ